MMTHNSEYSQDELTARSRVARKARRKLELIAAHVPVAGTLFKTQLEPAPAERAVVVSDTHIGDPYDAFESERLTDRLCESISDLGEVDELVLLGDIFDFWQSPFTDSLERGRYFFSRLLMLGNVRRIVYIIGNHDHRLFRMYYEEERAKRLRAGEIVPPDQCMPLTADCPSIEALMPEGACVPLSVTYPSRELEVRGRRVHLTHGHLLGLFERSFWQAKHSRLGTLLIRRNEKLDLDDMENFLSPYYEMLALSAEIPEIVRSRYWVYRMLSRAGRALGLQDESRGSKFRNTTIEENAALIEALLNHFCPEKPDYFLFGHTHKPGRLILPVSGVTAINTGCWLQSDSVPGPRNIYAEITDEVRLIQLKD